MTDITIEPKVVIALRGNGPLLTAKYMLKSRYEGGVVPIQMMPDEPSTPGIPNPGMSVDEVTAKVLDEQGFHEGIVAARYILEVNGAPNSRDTATADRVYPLLKPYDTDPNIDVKVMFLTGNQDMVELAQAKEYPCINKNQFDATFLAQF